MARLSTGQGGPRKTRVSRMAYWIEEDQHFRYLPVGPTHRQSVEHKDPDSGDILVSEGQYEAKGWVPLHRIPKNDPRRKTLPTNHTDLCHSHKVAPIMPEQAKAKSDA